MSDGVGRISQVWRFPVKSMLGETVTEVELAAGGLVGDRAYAMVDEETGKVVSAKSVRDFPDLFRCRAEFREPPLSGSDPPPVSISLPDGSSVTSSDPDSDEALSRFFGRRVRLTSQAPEDYTIDQFHPDIEGADPPRLRNTVTEEHLGAAFFGSINAPSPVAVGALFDLFPVSVLTSSTLEKLGQLSPGSRFDSRRFRMNVVVETVEPGFVENEWVGRALTLEDGPTLRVAMPDPRCVMPTLAQGDDLPRDGDILRTIARHNRLELEGGGKYPCAGVYAVVESPGVVRQGAAVALV